MDQSETPYALLLTVAAAVAAAVALQALRNRRARGRVELAVLMGGVVVWSLSSALQISSLTLAVKILWAKVEYLGMAVVPLAWLAFVGAHTGRLRFGRPRWSWLLAAVPVLTVLLMATNEAHHLVWVEARVAEGPVPRLAVQHGPWFWVHVAYSNLVLLAGLVLLAPRLRSGSRLYRLQAATLLLGLCAPWIANVAYVSGLTAGFDWTPFALTASGAAMAWALFRYRLLDVVPVARELLLEKMTDGVLVVDAAESVVDLNPAAARLLGVRPAEAVGRPAGEVLGPWAGGAAPDAAYDLTVTALGDEDGHAGQVYVWRDISRYRAAEAEVRAQKRLLEALVAVSRATAERPSLDATLQGALDVIAVLTRAEGGSLCLVDEVGAVVRGLFVGGGLSRIPDEQLPTIMDRGLSGWVARTRTAVLVTDTETDERWLRLPGVGQTIRASLIVPLSVGTKLLGILSLDHPSPGHFTHEHLSVVQAVAEQLAPAVRNAQMNDERARMAERQTMLYELLRAVGAQLDAAGVAEAAVQAVSGLTGWPNVILAVAGETREQWLVAAASRRLSQVRAPNRGGVIGRAFLTGQVQRVDDVSRDPDYLPDHPSIRSELAVPLRRGERILGVLNVESEVLAAFGPADVQLAESLAEAVALAFDNARLYEAAAAQQTRLQAVIEASRDGIVLVGMDRRVLVFSEPAHRLLGLPGQPSDWLGAPIDDILQALVEQAPEVVQTTLAELRRIRTGDEPTAEGEYEAPPRTIRWESEPVSNAGASLGRLLVLRDVTEERMLRQVQAERQRLYQAMAEQNARLQALIETSRDGIALLGTDGRFLVLNEAAGRLLHLEGGAASWLGRPVSDALAAPGERAPGLVELLNGAPAGAGEAAEGEYESHGRVVRWVTLPVLASDVAIGRLVVLRDVTAERALERLREDLTHTMVHDLRNPLTTVSAVLEQLEAGLAEALPAPRRDMLRIAVAGAQRMSTLVNAILDVSRLESGKMPLERECLWLRPLVEEALALQEPLARDASRTLANLVPEDLPAAWADPALVSRVLQNLVSNGLKFTPPGGGVRVRAAADGNVLRVSVSDDGPGVPPEMEGRLFEKFSTGRHKGRGSGLGLAFCRLAVEAHGGRIWAESGPGGATFSFTLPLSSRAGGEGTGGQPGPHPS